MTAPAVILDHITLSFADRILFQDLSFTIDGGCSTCLLGPSGCGKSTVLKLISGHSTLELNQMEIEKRPGRAFFVEEYGIPSYDELIIVANRAALGEKKLRKFVDALEEGVQYLVNHPDESWQLFIKGRQDLDDELNKMAWADTLSRFALRPGALDKNRYNRFAAFLQGQGIVKEVPALDNWAVELP